MKMKHKHCPCACEHPQQFTADDGKEYCGQCWVRHGELCEMVLCDCD